MTEKPKFETAFARLEEVVRLLEEGQTTLADSLALYEEGVRLLRVCHENLTEARRRVEVLTGEVADGKPVATLWEDDDRSLDEKAQTRGR